MDNLRINRLDQRIHDTVDAYKADLQAAERDCEVAAATVGALQSRVSILDAQSSTAEALASTAEDNFAAAKSTADALEGSQKAAYGALRHSVEAEQSIAATYESLHQLAGQVAIAVQFVSTLEAGVEQEVSKNGLAAFVAADAKATVTAARTAGAAALTALAAAAKAMVVAEQARMGAAALPAGLQRLYNAVHSFSIAPDSDLLGVPETMERVLPVKLMPTLASGNPATVVDTVRKELQGSRGVPSSADTKSFGLQNTGYAQALTAFQSQVSPQPTAPKGDDKGALVPLQKEGLLSGFYQLFQILSHAKQFALEGKTTAQSHLNVAQQDLDAKEQEKLYASERLKAAMQAVLT